MAIGRSTTEGTQQRHSSHWERWLEFTKRANINHYLDKLERHKQIELLSAFMHAVHTKQLVTIRTTGLMASKTCREHVASVAETLVLSGRRDPRYDLDGKLSRILSKQIKGYESVDKAKKQQQCIPVGIIERFCERATTSNATKALQENYLFAFFFAMRACEFLKTSGAERKTICVRLNGIIFIKDNKILPPSSNNIEVADKVAVRFEDQKNNDRNCIRHAARTNKPTLCPVRAAAKIVRRLQSLKADENSFIYLFRDNEGKTRELTAQISLIVLREFIKHLPEKEALGLRETDIGNRTLRSSAAMAMKLNDASDSDIMLHGRWKSDAYLDYIRPQTASFAATMSAKMIGQPAIMFSTTNTKTFQNQYDRNNQLNQTQNQMFETIDGDLESLLGPQGQGTANEVATITAIW
jgi:hypothetical protein